MSERLASAPQTTGDHVDVSWTPTSVEKVFLGWELPFEQSDGASLYFHPQPFVNVIKVDLKGIRVASEMFTEGQREEFLGFFVRDAS